MYLHPFCYIASHPHSSPSPSHATKLSLLISLLTNTPLSSPSLGCRRCEKSGNSYFVPGCSTLRLGSKRRKNAVMGRDGDAGESESLKWVVMAGEVEALEHVARELFFMSVCDSKRRVFAWQAYLSVVAIQEDFLHRDLLELPLESPPLCEADPRLSTNNTGNNLPNPTLTNHSLYIPLASFPIPKKKKIKNPQPRLIHRS
jgi:hypothetical protein